MKIAIHPRRCKMGFGGSLASGGGVGLSHELAMIAVTFFDLAPE